MIDQVFHYRIREISGDNWFYALFVYVENDILGRRELWDNLKQHNSGIGENALLVLGDFNTTLFPSETLRGINFVTENMFDFKDCIDEIEVEDISYSDIMYTWNGKSHGDNRVLKKIDQVMGDKFTSPYIMSFPQLSVGKP
ncbi:hypothetical protein Pint_05538 [Pistacia integerrima]|uniref:Uncharacterized protein n=1 Tax=Pistacia integerrima TaxID=434235 RepID=A0ACC0Z141_9ROSI|nr:hypothetical protein Pint_05538 [Pistacia integerrima]